MADENRLIDDRDLRFLLFEHLHAERLCALPHFADHSQQTFELYLAEAARLARQVVFQSYKPMDEQAAYFKDGRVHTHPLMRDLYPQIVELGMLTAARPYAVDGQQLPLCVYSMAASYLMAANLSAFGYCMLTTGAAHLIESFGSDALRRDYMQPMYGGQWTGTMALTEPDAGSSLGDLRTRARPAGGHYLIDGSKVFISGGDNTLSENIVHLALARIEGAAPGVKGISLFVVPKRRLQDDALVDNDVAAAGTFHKLGWRGIPSIALNFGEGGDCHGYLVGEPGRGLHYMFQMMNEARINIGLHGVATASVAYQQALLYARSRPQGRRLGAGADAPQVPIIEHADVRRMLLRQKTIVEGGLALVAVTARYADLAEHAANPAERERAQALLDLLTPITKSYPAEKGFEANTLAVQVHGGYGYTSEYLPEAWLRDQKLNSIHEGTTGIQSLDLLGRKVFRSAGATLGPLLEEIAHAIEQAREAGLGDLADALASARDGLETTSTALLTKAASDPDLALSHSADYLELASTVVVGWQWLAMATLAGRALDTGCEAHDEPFYRGKLQAARYYAATELPRVAALAALCQSCETSYHAMPSEWF
ncbi:MAG: acyl-CoA dehydrogenase [Myxococcales bacterium]|nr:acyl-CoA dehydrogenase [Myxococcales bacterium]